ncbi:hypothetical protein AB0K62_08845 [Streptomyces halstedii]|uniref:hypothetical protein n=1 Tax=Streptomyces halstedii TaxID=1944 RepID=UPI0034604401
MDNLCDICHHHAPADRYLCEACEYRLHTWLRTLPRQVVLLQACLRPEAGPAQRGGAGRAHAPLPVDLRVLDLIGPGHPVPVEDPLGDQSGGIPVTALLTGWAYYLAGDVPAVYRDAHGTVRVERYGQASAWPRTGTGITAWCTWLTRYLPYAVTRPWVSEMYTQFEDLVHRINRITHTKPRRTPKDAPCPGCEAFALVEREGDLHISCEACGHRLLPDAYLAHRDRIMPALTRVAIAIAAGHEEARQKKEAARQVAVIKGDHAGAASFTCSNA